jgi:hypothetical protein
LVALLLVVGLVVKFWPVMVGVIGLIVAAYWGRLAVDRHAERVRLSGAGWPGCWPAPISNTGGFWPAMSGVFMANILVRLCDWFAPMLVTLLRIRVVRNGLMAF